MFGYAFVSLTPEQTEARRKLLDQAGLRGYLLPIVLLLTTYVVRTASRLIWNPSQTADKKPNIVQCWFRRTSWLLGDTYTSEFGPLHVQVIGLVYVSVLLSLVIKDTGNDYMHVTKAFGHMAVSQLPVHYLLSVKHPRSPITLATGLTHERLNAYHRFLGRIIHAMLATHAILYLNFFLAIGVLGKRIKDWDVMYGLAAFWTVNILGLLALPPVRQKAYHRVFYRSHVMLSILLAVIVWLHVPYTRNYAAQAVVFWIGNGLFRTRWATESATASSESVGNHLVRLTLTPKKGEHWKAWVPGMHGYLNQGGLGPRTPFTVVELPQKNEQVQVQFVVRDLGGPMTSLLGKLPYPGAKPVKLELEGPYGEAKEYMPDALMRTSEPFLVVAGGVGMTYALPVYTALVEEGKSSSNVRLVWVVRRIQDAEWALDMMRRNNNHNVQIYVTQIKKDEKVASESSSTGVEILAVNDRPNFKKIVESFFGPPEQSAKSISVMVCGPSGLSMDLRRSVGRYAWQGRQVRWYEEQFGFGGS